MDIRNFFKPKKAKQRNEISASDFFGDESNKKKTKNDDSAAAPPTTSTSSSTIPPTNTKAPTDNNKLPEQPPIVKKKQEEEVKEEEVTKTIKEESPAKRRKVQQLPAAAAANEEEEDRSVAVTATKSAHNINQSMTLPSPATLLPTLQPQTLSNVTFCMTGVCETSNNNNNNMDRDKLTEYIKVAGGRVTTAVSGKTNVLLLLGDLLEDGRPVEAGMKYKKAIEVNEKKKSKKKGGEELLDVVRGQYDIVQYFKKLAEDKKNDDASTTETMIPVAPPPAKVVNPYAAKKINNPYAKKAPAISKPSTSTNAAAEKIANVKAQNNMQSDLFTTKYAPVTLNQILGNGESIRKMKDWVQNFGGKGNIPANKYNKNGASNNIKAVLISGPPGIGKTTAVHLLADTFSYQLMELNASDTRSQKVLQEQIGDAATGSGVISMKKGENKMRMLMLDEIDGLSGQDRNGMAFLTKLIKSSKIPIICACNDRSSQKMRALAAQTGVLDLKFSRPMKTTIARHLLKVAQLESIDLEYNAAEAIVESCGGDIRGSLNLLQMWAKSAKRNKDGIANERLSLTYKGFSNRRKEIQKDEVLRVNLFDAAKLILEGPKYPRLTTDDAQSNNIAAYSDLASRYESYFTDYSFMPLLVQQNYPKLFASQYTNSKIPSKNMHFDSSFNAEEDVLERLYQSAECISESNLIDGGGMSEMNWSLLPAQAILMVKAGYHSVPPPAPGNTSNGSFLPGYAEFSSWLGKNSSYGKKTRMLSNLIHHMNYNISGDQREVRLWYMPVLRSALLQSLYSGGSAKDDTIDKECISNVIDIMDEYGLDREDVFESLDEFTMYGLMSEATKSAKSKSDGKVDKFASKKFSDLDSKTKATFTREYNKRVHTSQALVNEQGVTKKSKKTKNVTSDEIMDNENESLESEEEDDAEAIEAMFRKKKKGSNKVAGTKPSAKKGKKTNAKAAVSKKKK